MGCQWSTQVGCLQGQITFHCALTLLTCSLGAYIKGDTQSWLEETQPRFEMESALFPQASLLRRVTWAPPCCISLSVQCVLQIAFALHLGTNQVSTARPIRAGFPQASCISDIFANILPVATILQSAVVDDDAGYAWLNLQSTGEAFREVNKKNLILICRLGSFDLEVTGGKRNMGPRYVSSSPSVAVITLKKPLSHLLLPPPLPPSEIQCGREGDWK